MEKLTNVETLTAYLDKMDKGLSVLRENIYRLENVEKQIFGNVKENEPAPNEQSEGTLNGQESFMYRFQGYLRGLQELNREVDSLANRFERFTGQQFSENH